MEPELKPCPFCGGHAMISYMEESQSERMCVCTSCGVRTGWHLSPHVVNVWNRRVYPEEVLRALDKQTPDLVMQLCNEWGGTDNMCPKCSAHVSGKFCANCGQRLDWSEV